KGGKVTGSKDNGGQSTSPAGRDFVGVKGAEHVYDARRGDESRAVVACRAQHIGTGGLEHPGEEVENARASVGQKTQSAEGIVRVRRKNITAQHVSRDRKSTNRKEEEYRARRTMKHQMAEARDSPCENCRRQGKRIRSWGRLSGRRRAWRSVARRGVIVQDFVVQDIVVQAIVHASSAEQRKNLFLDGAGDARFAF